MIKAIPFNFTSAKEKKYIPAECVKVDSLMNEGSGIEKKDSSSQSKRVVQFIIQPFQNVISSPAALRKLFLTDFLCWMGLYAHNYFATDFFATVVYGAKPDTASSEGDNLFAQGVRMGSIGLLLHSLVGKFVLFPLQYKTCCNRRHSKP